MKSPSLALAPIAAQIKLISIQGILIANSFMQQPMGYVLRNGRAEMESFWALVSNPHVFVQFPHVITVELNYSDDWNDPLITPENRRYGQLAWVLRAATLMDIDCWSKVPGHPLQPGMIGKVIESRLAEMEGA